MSNWRDELAKAVSFAAENNMGHYRVGAWASLVHMGPHRISVHQRYPDGEVEGFAMRYSGERGNDHCTTHEKKAHLEPIQDAYLVVVGTSPCDRMRFVQHSRATRCDKSADPKSEAPVISKRISKRKKDPARPRGYVSGFNFFVQARTPLYIRDKKGSTNEINKMLGEEWKSIDAEEKKFFQKLGEDDKTRYYVEHEAYKPTSGHECAHSRIKCPKTIEASLASAGNLELGSGSAYTHFSKQETIGVRSSKASHANGRMSTAFGRRWTVGKLGRMPEEERVLYMELEQARKQRIAVQRANCISASL